MERIAQCSCGSVKLTAAGTPSAVVACHCLACQRRTGSVFGVGAYYSPEQVTFSGVTKKFSRSVEPNGMITFDFCPQCGTTLYWKVEGEPERIGVAVGAFADPDFPGPIRSVWEQSKHSWVQMDVAQTHFPKGRT
jgi:hypothetical protein